MRYSIHGGCDDIEQWLRVARTCCRKLAAELSDRDLEPDHAPERPALIDGLRLKVIEPYLLLCQWAVTNLSDGEVPRWRVRVDTIARPRRHQSTVRRRGSQGSAVL